MEGYKREISFWIKNHYDQNEIVIDNNVEKEISYYFKNGGNFFIELAERGSCVFNLFCRKKTRIKF